MASKMPDKKLTDSEIVKALEYAREMEQEDVVIYYEDVCTLLDLINRIQEENDDLFFKLTGVMHSVDKWLDGEELNQDEVNRAATMREKTLRITKRWESKMPDKEYDEFVAKIKLEAYKEFAERLKNIVVPIVLSGGKYKYDVVTMQGVDYVLKEMVGEAE